METQFPSGRRSVRVVCFNTLHGAPDPLLDPDAFVAAWSVDPEPLRCRECGSHGSCCCQGPARRERA